MARTALVIREHPAGERTCRCGERYEVEVARPEAFLAGSDTLLCLGCVDAIDRRVADRLVDAWRATVRGMANEGEHELDRKIEQAEELIAKLEAEGMRTEAGYVRSLVDQAEAQRTSSRAAAERLEQLVTERAGRRGRWRRRVR